MLTANMDHWSSSGPCSKLGSDSQTIMEAWHLVNGELMNMRAGRQELGNDANMPSIRLARGDDYGPLTRAYSIVMSTT